MKTTAFSIMANTAKARMNKRQEFRDKNKTASLRAEKNYLASVQIDEVEKREQEIFDERVKEIIMSGNMLCALKYLVDESFFDCVDDGEKERRILKLSKKFIESKKRLGL